VNTVIGAFLNTTIPKIPSRGEKVEPAFGGQVV
jgi:hypothetical protein